MGICIYFSIYICGTNCTKMYCICNETISKNIICTNVYYVLLLHVLP